MGTVCCAEGVVDVGIGEICEGLGELWVIGFFARVEADIFEDGYGAGAHGVYMRLCIIVELEEWDIAAEELGEYGGDGLEGEVGVVGAPRTT